MFKVNQNWSPLKVCAVGQSYPPDYYNRIKSTRLRSQFRRIAEETEEDYQGIIAVLEQFNVEVIRPEVVIPPDDKWVRPAKLMNPRDQFAMCGDTFLPYRIDDEGKVHRDDGWEPVYERIDQEGNKQVSDLLLRYLPSSGLWCCGKDVYFGAFKDVAERFEKEDEFAEFMLNHLPKKRHHLVHTDGHVDGCFKPVKPGLIFSIMDMEPYTKTFPGWEVVYFENESWHKMDKWCTFRYASRVGSWYLDNSDEEIQNFVNVWLRDWVGHAAETVFDVNSLTINEENIIVNQANPLMLDACKRHGIKAHICPLRHRYFWDGGIHCSTADLDREGEEQDYFPERGETGFNVFED
tara:strand:- start:638 stop:1687 length:1050 start_codon:yes stop_codon:yes gene_type:complete